jgi:hypothetical protein
MPSSRLLKHLDAVSFLGIGIWDFCFRSLFKEYGQKFLFKVVLSHPAKTFQGLCRYKKLLQERPSGRSRSGQPLIEENVLIERIRANKTNFLVGLGFCLKPRSSSGPEFSCPSGRANHDCLYLEQGRTHPACLGCAIYKISKESLEKNASVYIMTSAEDLANDFLIPQIDTRRFPLSLLFLCSYSVQAIIPALLICGAESLFITYTRGDCRNYEQWRRADLGNKKEVTELNESSWDKVLDFFGKIDPVKPRPQNFKRKGNIFIPEQSVPSITPIK